MLLTWSWQDHQACKKHSNRCCCGYQLGAKWGDDDTST